MVKDRVGRLLVAVGGVFDQGLRCQLEALGLSAARLGDGALGGVGVPLAGRAADVAASAAALSTSSRSKRDSGMASDRAAPALAASGSFEGPCCCLAEGCSSEDRCASEDCDDSAIVLPFSRLLAYGVPRESEAKRRWPCGEAVLV